MARVFSIFFAILLLTAAFWLLAFGKRPSQFVLPDGHQTPIENRTIVTFWEKWSGHEAKALQDLIDKFNLSQTKIFVNLVSMSQINQKLLIATAGGDPPDIAGLWAAQIAPYTANHALEPLDELLADSTIHEKTYKPYIWKICTPPPPPTDLLTSADSQTHLYSVSSTPSTCALYFNRDHFLAAGLDPTKLPQTIEELDELADKLTHPKPHDITATNPLVRTGFLPNQPGWLDFYWGIYFGNQLYDETRGQFQIDTPAQIAAYQWYQNYPLRFPNADSLQTFQSGFGQFNSTQNPFISGKVSIILQGPFFVRFIEFNRPELAGRYMVGFMPHPKALHLPPGTITLGDLDNWVIPRGAKHKPEALEVLRFLTRQENMEYLCKAHAKPSPLMQVSTGFLKNHPNPYIHIFEQAMLAPRVIILPRSPVWERVQSQFSTGIANMWRNPAKYPVAPTLRETQKICDEYVRRYNEYAAQRREISQETHTVFHPPVVSHGGGGK